MSSGEMLHPLTVHERPRPGRVQAVFFDWGGTLTPWQTIELGQQWRVFAREVNGVRVDSADVTDEDLARARELGERITAVEERARQRTSSEGRASSLDQLLSEAGVDAREDRHHVALAAYRRFWEPRVEINPRARELWSGLRSRGLRVGVLSNSIWSRDYHRDVFERAGVADLIDADLYSSELHLAKPQAEAFEAACAAIGVKPTNAVHVGDRLFEDILGAQDVGMRAIWLPHEDKPTDQQVTVDVTPDAVATDLLEVLDIVDTWLAESS